MDHVKRIISIKLLKDCSNTKIYDKTFYWGFPISTIFCRFLWSYTCRLFPGFKQLKSFIINALTNDILKMSFTASSISLSVLTSVCASSTKLNRCLERLWILISIFFKDNSLKILNSIFQAWVRVAQKNKQIHHNLVMLS